LPFKRNLQRYSEGPLAGDIVQTPENEEDSSYLYRKKLLTVGAVQVAFSYNS
jgi:hypothetical protein